MSSVPSLKIDKATIPQIGLGTWQSTAEEAYNAVLSALKAGYKHIDSAAIYGNEEQVGKAIKDSGIPRTELFVTTKLWNTDQQQAAKALDISLKKLGLDYVDLYLIHWPVTFNPNGNPPLLPVKTDGSSDNVDPKEWDYVKTYKDVQKLVATGKTKAVGISNFTIPKIQKLLDDPEVTVTPAALQVELHPLLPQPELVKFAQSNGILVEAYSPFGSTGAPVLSNETLLKLAEKHGVSPATIAISWAVWRGTVVLPKSIHAERIQANLNHIKLTDEEGEEINNIHKVVGEKRIVNPNWGLIFED